MLNNLKLRKIKGKLFTPRYMIDDKEDMVLAPPKPKPIEDKCEICGGRFTERSCKVICRNCGFTRDCSDPFK